MKPRLFKLSTHARSATRAAEKDEDLLISSRDFADWKEGDVVEIYNQDDENYKLLLQVSDREEKLQANSISLEQSIVQTFQFRQFSSVCVNRIEDLSAVPKLDLVEVLLKDQYFGRSEMWRFGEYLRQRIVFRGKRIEFSCMRVTIHQLWFKGEQLDSGYIDESTRFVFRSQSAVFDIFIQASSEMWEFDPFGDCYFEKAIDGFIRQLFEKWRERECSHDYTIVVFSRVYYDSAQSIDDFPPASQSCIMHEPLTNRYYEDFYDVVVQNERFVPTENNYLLVLTKLRRLFNSQDAALLHFHQTQTQSQSQSLVHSSSNGAYSVQSGLSGHPSAVSVGNTGSLRRGGAFAHARISSASQGNILETLNLTISHKYKYNTDRNFDRTGRVSVLVSAGQGVFEVNRQLSSFTGQCTIDLGIAIDLVCLGEQPLHAVPLFKYTRALRPPHVVAGTGVRAVAECDDYSIPTWINLSFYRSENSYRSVHFVPQIKINVPNAHQRAVRGCSKCMPNAQPYNHGSSSGKAHLSSQVRQSSKSQLLTAATSASIRSGDSLAVGAHSSANVNGTVAKPVTLERQASQAPDSSSMITVPNFGMRASYYDEHDRRVFSRANMRHSGASRHAPHYRRARYSSNVYDHLSRRKSMAGTQTSKASATKCKSRRSGHHGQSHVDDFIAHLDEQTEYPHDQLPEADIEAESDPLNNSSDTVQRDVAYSSMFDELAYERKRERAKSLDDLAFSVTTLNIDLDDHTPSEELRSARSKNSLCSGTPMSPGAIETDETESSDSPVPGSRPIPISVSSANFERNVVGSAGSPPPPLGNGFAVMHSMVFQHAPLRALVNPFQPSRISSIRTTWHRRRWAHVFPLDKDGLTLQPHHKATVSSPDETRFAEQQMLFGSTRKPAVMLNSLGSAAYEQQRAALAGGEPDWSPGVTTYVDWRSLVLPASLPVTTDYLPDEHTLNTQYSRNDYWLDPALMVEEYVVSTRRKTNVSEIFRELVSTRLAQGFQIVVTSLQFPQQVAGTQTPAPLGVAVGPPNLGQLAVSPPLSAGAGAGAGAGTGVGTAPHLHVATLRSAQKPLVATQKPSAIININMGDSLKTADAIGRSLKATEVRKSMADTSAITIKGSKENKLAGTKAFSTSPAVGGFSKAHAQPDSSSPPSIPGLKREYKVSYGRFFHQLELDTASSRIHVSLYRPKHTFLQQLSDYTFRFRVPHLRNYESNRFRLATEQVETNWNAVDNYVCARGEDEQTYPLQDSFHRWRTRTILMPAYAAPRRQQQGASGTASSTEAPVVRCDVHAEKTIEEQLSLIDSFVKLVETMNRCTRYKPQSSASAAPAAANSSAAAASSAGFAGTTNIASSVASATQPVRKSSQATGQTAAASSSTSTASRVSGRDSPVPAPTGAVHPAAQAQTQALAVASSSSSSPVAVFSSSLNQSQRRRSTWVLPQQQQSALPAASTDASQPTGGKRFAITNGCSSLADGLSLATTGNLSSVSLNPIQEGQPQPPMQRSPAPSGSIRDEAAASANVISLENPSDESLQLLRCAMLDEMRFVSQTGMQLPQYSFVSHDAAIWLKNNVEFSVANEVDALDQACTLMQHMLSRCMVVRATNLDDAAARHLFIYGYYLYAFVPPSDEQVGVGRNAATQPAGSIWGPRRIIEVEFVVDNRRLNSARTRFDTACERLKDDEDEHVRNVTIDVDRDQHKLDRVEWLNLRFSRFFNPLCAFQLDLRWLVASGSVLGDLITAWCNRAAQHNLHLMLVPVHMFVKDDERSRTDPLSCPIFLPLNMKVIADAILDRQPSSQPSDYESPPALDESHWLCVRTLQAASLRRCGFLPIGYEPTKERYDGAAACQHFVHCSGCASVSVSVPHEQDFTKTGYFWFWNHMSVRRLHSTTQVDEQFKEALFSDFKAFCEGNDGRLFTFSCATLKRGACSEDDCISASGINIAAE